MSKGKTNRHGFKKDLRNQRLDVPQTLQELAEIVRNLRKAQNYAYYEPDSNRRYHLTDLALSLGRQVDYTLRILEINDRTQHP